MYVMEGNATINQKDGKGTNPPAIEIHLHFA